MLPVTYQEGQAPPSYNQYPQPLRRRSTERTCLAYVPWTSILSGILVFIGIGFWVNNGVEGGKNAKGALKVLGIDYGNSKLVERAIVGTSVVLIFLILAIVAVSFYRCYLEYRRDTEGRLDKAPAYLFANFTVNSALWVMIVWIFVAFGIFAVAAAASYALDRGARTSIQTFDKQVGTVKSLYDAAEDFIVAYEAKFNKTSMADSFSSRVADLKKMLKQKNQTCPTYCLDLTKLSFLKGNKCICDSIKLREAQDKAHAAWKSLIPSIIGLIVVFIGLTWMLMNLVAQFVRTHSDVKWTRDTEEVLLEAGNQYYSEKSQQFFMQP